jgi:capsular polysaccharide transport system permease protein
MIRGFERAGAFSMMRSYPILGTAVIVILLAALYWMFIASDRYVSEAHVIIQKTDMGAGQVPELTGLLGDMGSSQSSDQLLLRDHLLSVDMVKILDEKLHLREHYSDSKWDLLSRMWGGKTATLEDLHDYYLRRVTVDYDEYSGVLIIRSEAFDPEMANAITEMLVVEGERFMNEMAHRLARGQVVFLEEQVSSLSDRLREARKAVLDFQNKHGLISPQGTAENLVGIVNTLESKLVELQARRTAMLGYLMEKSSDITDLDLQITAVKKQIELEKQRLTSHNGKTLTLNETVEEYQYLQTTAEFAQDIYKTALVALEQGRIEATRTLKKMSVLQSPTMPQYPVEPRRIYNTVVSLLVALLLAGVVHLIVAIVRDHKD